MVKAEIVRALIAVDHPRRDDLVREIGQALALRDRIFALSAQYAPYAPGERDLGYLGAWTEAFEVARADLWVRLVGNQDSPLAVREERIPLTVNGPALARVKFVARR